MGRGDLLGVCKWTENLCLEKCPQGACLPPPLGYMHIYDHNIQTSSLKPLGQSKPNFMWSIVRKGGVKVNINGQGHMTKMATMAVNSKNLYKSYSSEPEDL